jgi:hypothetical protein
MRKPKRPKEHVPEAIAEVGKSLTFCVSLFSAMLQEALIDVLLENGTLSRRDLQKVYADVRAHIEKESLLEPQRKLLLGLLTAKAANHKVAL